MRTIVAGLTLGIAVFFNTACVEAAADPEAVKVATEIMFDQYGNTYDAKNNCWAYSYKTDQGDSTQYCMRPSQFQVVEEKGVKMLYLIAVSTGNIADNPDYSYSLDEPGLMGAFKVSLGGPQGWIYKAFDNKMGLGIGGQCSCSDIKLVQLSSTGAHAWLYTVGGTWQGVTNASFSILVPIKGQFQDVSSIPQTQGEEDPDVTYQISVKPDPAVKGFYPLHVLKLKSGKTVEEFDVAFDPKAAIYALPAGH